MEAVRAFAATKIAAFLRILRGFPDPRLTAEGAEARREICLGV